MARRLRVELEGGLYHLIARGNDRQDVFHTAEHHGKFLSLLRKNGVRLAFLRFSNNIAETQALPYSCVTMPLLFAGTLGLCRIFCPLFRLLCFVGDRVAEG